MHRKKPPFGRRDFLRRSAAGLDREFGKATFSNFFRLPIDKVVYPE
jgi:hypothetical protein